MSQIKYINYSNLEEVSKCHMESFPNSLSASLGLKYNIKYLEWFIISEDRFLIGIESDKKIIGYVGGSAGTGSTSKIIQHSFFSLITSLLKRPWLFFTPKILNNTLLIKKNIYARIVKKFEKKTFIDNLSRVKSFGLVVIGVNPKYHNKNYGTIIINEFDKKCIEMGYEKAHLSVKKDNENAVKFYLKNGWHIVEESEFYYSLSKDYNLG